MPERDVRMEDMMPLLCERLAAGQQVRFAPMGTSMLPMLHPGRDSVTLSPFTGAADKYDLLFYRRADGTCVLHRAVRGGDPCLCTGDNQFEYETVAAGQILARVTAFTRNGRERSAEDRAYRLYCRVWHFTRPARRLWRGLRVRVRRRLG